MPSPSLFDRVAAALAADYELIRLLGQGGMASVFLAREKALNRLVALKVLAPDLASPSFRTRFAREAEAAAQLLHPHIVPIYRVGEAAGLAYYAMGFVEGETLGDRMSREGTLPVPDAVRIAAEVATALGAAHRRGIIHRDVKPQNIMLEAETGRALVTDFGIARLATSPAAGSDPDEERLTGLGMVMGTPRYMSPEQALGERDLTPGADMYALGIVLYEMVTGEYPFREARGARVMMAHLTQQPIPVREVKPDVPENVATAIESLLDKNPERRPGPAALRASLGERLSEPAIELNKSKAPRRTRVWLLATAVMAVLVLVGVGAVLQARGSGAPAGVDPRKSILIGFFDNTSHDPSLQWLRMGGVDLMTHSLRRWNDLQVVEVDRLLDLARQAGVDPELRLSRDHALAMARQAGVWTVAVGSILPADGSIRVTLNLYDVASGRQLLTESASGPDSLPHVAFDSLATRILDLADAPRTALGNVEPPTGSLDAYRAYLDGISARNRWHLDSAVTAFRRAVELDSAFALAYYELSNAVYIEEVLSPNPTFIALADSALRYAQDRPPRERDLIEAYHALVHADFERARRLYRDLLRRDSTITDAWVGLGAAAQLDMTLRKDARGRDSMPTDLNLAWRSYQRALELDPGDHRLYGSLANLVAQAGLEDEQAIPAFRTPPSGALNTLGDRFPVGFYAVVMVGDSFRLFRSDSVGDRFPAPVLDSLREKARERTRGVLDRWLQVAPGEGQAYMLKSALDRLDKDWDGALAALRQAERLGAIAFPPFAYQRLGLLLHARRLEESVRLGDSLIAAGPPPGGTFLRSGPVNTNLLAGHIVQAKAGIREFFSGVRAITRDSQVLRFLEQAEAWTPVRIGAALDRVNRDDARQMDDRLRQIYPTLSRDNRSGWEGLVMDLMFVAASLGDTATVERWFPQVDARPDLRALARARAGNRTGALAAYQAAALDTARNSTRLFVMGRLAEYLGRPGEALDYYAKLDASEIETTLPDADWILLVRSLALQGRIYEAQGDLARARQYYRRFVRLWEDADPALKSEVNAVERALAELERRDRPDR